MNKITKNIAALIAFGIGTTTISFAQVTQQKIGDNPTIINPNAALQVDSSTKGLLLPRLGLTATNSFAPLAAHVAGMTVYNTATAGSGLTAVTPGYYYNDGSQWVRVATGGDAKTEPWRVYGGMVEANTNTQDIYQNAKVGIGNFSSLPLTQYTKQFEVKGDFKSEITAGGGVVGTEVGSPLNPTGAMHYWSNGTNYRIASANNVSSALTAITGATTNTFAATSTNSEMSSVNGTNSLSTVRAENTGNFFMESYNVTANFGSTFSLQNDGVRIRHTNTNGSGNPFPSNNDSEIFLQKANGVRFSFRDPDGLNPQAYWFPITTGNAGQVLTQSGTGGKIEWRNPSTLFAEVDGVIGNEVTNATTNGGLTRAGAGTNVSPYTLGLIPGSATGNVMTWNGTAWNPANPVNIYNANGTLTADRTVNMDSKDLTFSTAGNGNISFYTNNAGMASQNIIGTTTRGNLTLTGGSATVDLYVDNGGVAQLTSRGNSTGLNVGTTTGQMKPLNLVTNGLIRATVTPTGEMAIGATTIPNVMSGATVLSTPKFHVVGDVSITGKYYTTNSVYADYVFEKYFKGSSDINPNYEFKSLNYVKDFIKANNHLPGVESINDLAKAETGYTFDMTKLTIQSLEKIEELYLHTIEQQDKIDQQQTEIEKLKEQSKQTTERLQRLEEILSSRN